MNSIRAKLKKMSKGLNAALAKADDAEEKLAKVPGLVPLKARVSQAL